MKPGISLIFMMISSNAGLFWFKIYIYVLLVLNFYWCFVPQHKPFKWCVLLLQDLFEIDWTSEKNSIAQFLDLSKYPKCLKPNSHCKIGLHSYSDWCWYCYSLKVTMQICMTFTLSISSRCMKIYLSW